MPSTSTLVIVTVSLLSLLSPPTAQASRMQDLFESALDTVLCSSVKQMHQTIIDIRTSINRGANLIDGKWVRNVDTCISQCCGMETCDFALYKTEGQSASGKNCYFVNCGDEQSNCVMVEHSGFTSVFMGGRKKENADENEKMVHSTRPPTPPLTTSTPTTHTVTTVTPSHKDIVPTTAILESDLETTSVSLPVSHSNSIPEPRPSNENSGSSSDTAVNKQVNSGGGGVGGSGQNTNPPDGGSGMIAVAIVGVVCFTIIVIVVGVLMKKVWMDHRRKRFRNVDYLINGMYT